jgi:antitoxin component of RelBE/YafQ-DinJ toxin-antitoxin module
MKTISAKVDDELYETAKRVAEANGLTVSKMLKQAFTSATIKDTSYEQKILFELNRIGNNLNQISKYANTHKKLDMQILSSLARIEDDLKKLL